ncbi:MAG: hypothetical protein M9894_18145 [Planctomycetes bacterium]|nr:hypothetical protein [Planctomycetota bacterium]
MGASYGLGLTDFLVAADASRDDRLETLRAITRAGGAAVRDAFDGEAVEVAPDGAATTLDPARAAALRAAIDASSGHEPYRAFEYLEEFSVCVEGAAAAEPVPLPGGATTRLAPLAAFVEALDELIGREEAVREPSRALHRRLRALYDEARALGLPLTLGDA